MRKKEWPARGLLLALLAATCGPLASCVSYDYSSASDYIGPADQPTTQPAPLTALTAPASCPASQPATQPAGPISVTVNEAILRTLESNQSLIVQRFNPQIRRTGVDVQRAAFDPTFTSSFSGSRNKTASAGDAGPSPSVSQSATGQIGLQEFLPTGTTIAGTARTNFFQNDPDQFNSRVGLTVTQSLLQGFGLDVNLASLRQAKLDVLSSQYELRGFAQNLVAQTEQTYWDYVLAQRQIEIVSQSLQLAQEQRDETIERIRVGQLAETELAAAEATVAQRNQDLIVARSNLATTKLQMLRLLSPSGPDALTRDLILRDQPTVPDIDLGPVDEHVQLADRLRPELNQARLQINRGELDIVKTRNGLLPQLDLFVTLGRTGYANSFGPSLNDISHGNSYDVQTGLAFSYPPLNRAAQASYHRSVLSRDQSIEALSNLTQLAEQDVRTAYINVATAKELVPATAVTRKFQEETVRAEMEKFRVGRSTTLLVGQAQRDLLVSQIAEVQAVAAYLKALVELYLQEGSLLERRGLQSPGGEAVQLAPLR